MIHFHLFSLWFPIASYANVLLLLLFSNPCHFENQLGLFVHIFVYFVNFVTTFIIAALAVWVLDGRFVTNFVILYLSGSIKFTGQQFFSHVGATPAVARFLGVNQYYAKLKSALLKNTARWK